MWHLRTTTYFLCALNILNTSSSVILPNPPPPVPWDESAVSRDQAISNQYMPDILASRIGPALPHGAGSRHNLLNAHAPSISTTEVWDTSQEIRRICPDSTPPYGVTAFRCATYTTWTKRPRLHSLNYRVFSERFLPELDIDSIRRRVSTLRWFNGIVEANWVGRTRFDPG